MTPSLPVPTHWISLEDSEPPEDVWLFLHAYIPKEEGQEPIVPVLCGYFSSRTKQFIDTEFRCINEVLDITHYSVCTKPSGGVIEVSRG
jgi:hypothetical protein